MSNFSCSNCCYRKENACLRKNVVVDLNDYCNLHANEVERCEMCNTMLVQPLVVIDREDNVHTLCVNCYRRPLNYETIQ